MSHTQAYFISKIAKRMSDQVADPQAFAKAILKSFAKFTVPEIQSEISTNFGLINILDPTAGGSSIKPGNICLNWRELFKKAPELVLTGAGVTQLWLVPFAALYLWNLVSSLAKIDITPAQAMTMHALWNAGEQSKWFPEPEALNIVNAFRKSSGSRPLSLPEFANVVNDLVALECIELTAGRIWLRESLNKSI